MNGFEWNFRQLCDSPYSLREHGLYFLNVGYGRSEVGKAIAELAKELAYYHAYVGHGTEALITLSKMIIDRAPANISKIY